MTRPSFRWARALLLLSGAAGGWLALAAASIPRLLEAHPADGLRPVALTATLASALLMATATWLLLLLFIELGSALLVEPSARRRRVSLPARAGVAALVALALGSGTSAAVATSPGPLPSPDRPESHGPTHLEVRPGDSLWRLATEHLVGERARLASVQEAVQTLYETNQGVIGPDPDHIRPGTRLRVPAPRGEQSP